MLEIFVIGGMAAWLNTTAKKYKKPQSWLYALLGVVTYIIVGYGSGILIVIMSIETEADIESATYLAYLGIPIGVLAVWILQMLLKRNWQAQLDAQQSDDQLLDADDLEI